MKGLAFVVASLTLSACGSDSLSQRQDRSTGPAHAEASPQQSQQGEDSDAQVGASKSSPEAISQRPDDSIDFTQVQMGLYWMGMQGRLQKANKLPASRYYDPQKPTLIYVHGWQQGSVAMEYHESTYRDVLGQKVDLADAWIKKGWNVGIFLWTEFADDQLLLAEQKIWDPKAMTWIDPSNTRKSFSGNKAASEILFQEYTTAMSAQKAPEIRFAGHSLGSQMVSILTQKVREGIVQGRLASKLMPSRVVLLDPFFSNGAKAYLQQQSNAAVVTQYAKQWIAQGTTLEIYRTSSLSLLPVADAHAPLISLSAFRNIYTDGIFTTADQGPKHNYAVAYYLWSFAGKEVPFEKSGLALPTDFPVSALSALSAKADIQKFMNSDFQVRSSDMSTSDPNDDPCLLEKKGSI